MSLGEFELIERYFKRPVRHAALGVGDDCALLRMRPGMSLAISSDMLVEGRHFLPTIPPERLGHKALAVNLSDLAACGARPLAFTLALSLPRAEPDFLSEFAAGLLRLADQHDCELIGGDTTAGPLNICITVFGEVPIGSALLRSGAGAGDDIYVSGQPGLARLALEVFRGLLPAERAVFEAARSAMEMPTPRIELGLALRGIATSAVDVSDGLLADLGHILHKSAVGATIDVDALPESDLLADLPPELRRQFVLAGGDDYELLFTARRSDRQAVVDAAWGVQMPVTRIGTVQASPGLRLVDGRGCPERDIYARYDHFRT